ncbi:MAG TPA: DUF1906 domain-containing protein [Candidatus Dormibacteraeota bacterium]|jgi:hypothetical protein|nr:DUF1906 domain-containing protein [Candidatus Dormibacteraeota bacterium]
MASADTVPAGWQTVGLDGVSVSVPGEWPVRDLRNDPTVCAVMDQHAVYLGSQGPAANCPVQALGRQTGVQIQPVDGQDQAEVALAAGRTTVNGVSVDVNDDPGAAGMQIAVVPLESVVVTIPYGGDAALAEQIFSTLTSSGGSAQGSATASAADPVPGTAVPATTTASVYTGGGFDTCSAPSQGNMQSWLGSPYHAVGVYIGGTNAACLGGNLNASWVSAVGGMGWHMIPIYVGLQAPCANQTGMTSINASLAATQGTQNADDAVGDAGALGIGAGDPIFFDMEAYQSSCAPTVLAFLTAWTQELHAKGYLSGVYSGVDTGVTFMLKDASSFPDIIWFAQWDNTATTSNSEIPSTMFVNHQRMKQYQGGHNETYGGATINIDSDQCDATLAG